MELADFTVVNALTIRAPTYVNRYVQNILPEPEPLTHGIIQNNLQGKMVHFS
jgi:hypothetical protein